MPFRFTIPRLLLVAAVFTAAFWLVKLLGLPWSILAALLVAIPLSGIVLVAKERDAEPIIRLLFYCGLGMFVGWAFCPRVRPPYEPGDEFRSMIIGAVGGAIIAWILNTIFNPPPEK
ncbi:MAG: hypothetical protein WCB27_10340 [Thermoguttaceae bacterium]|jgi:hypothetical protein